MILQGVFKVDALNPLLLSERAEARGARVVLAGAGAGLHVARVLLALGRARALLAAHRDQVHQCACLGFIALL